MAARAMGEIDLPAPTFVSLLRLQECHDVEAALEQTETYPHLRFNPRPARGGNTTINLYEGDAAYDDPTTMEATTPRHRLTITPTGWHYERSGDVTGG